MSGIARSYKTTKRKTRLKAGNRPSARRQHLLAKRRKKTRENQAKRDKKVATPVVPTAS